MEQILKERGQFDLNSGFFDDLFNADEILLPAPGKNDRNFKKVFKLFLIHDNRMLAERAFYCLI